MKGKSKIKSKNIFISMLLIFALLLTPFTAVVRYIGRVFATGSELTDVNGKTLSLVNFKKEVKLNEFYQVPNFKLDGNSYTYANAEAQSVTYKVVSPLGKEVPIVEDENNAGVYGFVATMNGYYRLTVTAVKDGSVSTQIKNLKIEVKAADVSISYPVNSEYVIPNKAPAGASILLPVPNINNDDATGYTLEVKVKGKNESFDDVTALTLDESGKFYRYTPASTALNGVYEVRYQYLNGSTVVSTISKTFEYVSTSDFIEKMKLEFSLNSSMISTAVAGVTSTLPYVTIKDTGSNTNEEVNAYLKIVVKYHNVENDTYVDVTDKVLDGFKFTPNALGNYYISYQAVIPYSQMKDGLEDVVSEIASYAIRDVVDNKDPEILYTNGYEVEDGKISSVGEFNVNPTTTEDEIFEELGDLTNTIPSLVVLNKVKADLSAETQELLGDSVGASTKVAEILLPALYAKDNFSKTYADFTLTREIRGVSESSYSTIKLGNKEYAVNEMATYVISAPGTYYVRYTVKDSAGNEVYKTFTIKAISENVFNEDYSEIKPEITMSEIPSSVRSDGSIEFTFSSSDKYDSSPENSVVVTATATNNFAGGTNQKEIGAEYISVSGNKYVIDVNAFAEYEENELGSFLGLTEISIVATSRNDYNEEAASVTKTVKVIDVNDNTPATIELTDGTHTFNYLLSDIEANNLDADSIQNSGLLANTKAPFDQKQTIYLPDFTFTEDHSTSVKFDLSITDKNGNTVPVAYNFALDREYDGEGYKFNLTNTSFVASYSGMYTVTYKITDVGNNITARSFAIFVNDTEKPSIVIVDDSKLNTTIELGTTLKLPVAGLLDDGKVVDLSDSIATTDVEISSNGSQYFDYATYEFTPEKTGTYTITYIGKDEAGNPATPVTYTIKVDDTTSPEIKLSRELEIIKAWPEDADSIEIDVPFATVYDINLNLDDDASTYAEISVTNAKGTKQKLLTRENGDKYFVAESQGIYTVTYTASDLGGLNGTKNTTTVTKTIAVGNCYQPELTFVNGYEIPASLTIGDTFTLSLDEESVQIKDQDGSEEEITTTVTLTDPEGNTVEGFDENYKNKMDKAGDYKLTITLSDGQTENKVYTYTITVNAKEAKENSKISSTVGTILIIVSILALGAVVVYFVVTNKKGSSKKTTKKDSKVEL